MVVRRAADDALLLCVKKWLTKNAHQLVDHKTVTKKNGNVNITGR
jgi:hypothetical protein